jgi:hypothetical protein
MEALRDFPWTIWAIIIIGLIIWVLIGIIMYLNGQLTWNNDFYNTHAPFM